MDPLSIIVSSIALVGALNATVRKAREVVTANSALLALNNEISDLTVLLQASEECLRDSIQGPNLQRNANLLTAAQSVQGKLQAIELRIRHWTGMNSKRRYLDVRRLNWFRFASKASTLKDEIRALRLEFMTILNTVAIEKSTRIQLHLEEIQFLSKGVIAGQEAFRSSLDTNHHKQLLQLTEISTKLAGIRLQESQSLEETGEYSNEQPDDQYDQDASSSTGSLEKSPKAFHHNGSILFDSKQMTAISAVGIRTAQFSRMACKPWCSCICHAQKTLKSPSFMERLVGSLFVGYTGIPRLRSQCNQQSCHLASPPMIYITYYFPAWFLARMVSLMIASTPLAGPVVSLKTQRAVPGDAEIFLCAKTVTSGVTALHFAISYQHLDVCRFLLNANADPFLEDRVRWTAADNAWAKILSGRFPREKELTLRRMFSDTEYLERWNLTILHKIVLELSGRDLKNELEESTAEIDTVDTNGRTALSFAAERCDLNALAPLLQYGADPKIDSPHQGSPLHSAATALSPAAIPILLDHGAMVDCTTAYLQTPLHYAAAYNSSENHAEALLEAGANPDFRDYDGMTPLHWTAVSGNLPVATTLLARGADPDIADKHGHTVLALSIKSNRHALISLLLNYQPQTLGKLANGDTILHVVALNADLETMKRLRAFQFDASLLDVRDANGRTASAILRGREDYSAGLEDEFMQLVNVASSLEEDESSESDDEFADALEQL